MFCLKNLLFYTFCGLFINFLKKNSNQYIENFRPKLKFLIAIVLMFVISTLNLGSLMNLFTLNFNKKKNFFLSLIFLVLSIYFLLFIFLKIFKMRATLQLLDFIKIILTKFQTNNSPL